MTLPTPPTLEQRNLTMMKRALIGAALIGLAGCTDADVASHNLSTAADRH